MKSDPLQSHIKNNVDIFNIKLLNSTFISQKILPINYNNSPYILSDTNHNDVMYYDGMLYPDEILRENYGSTIEDYAVSGNLAAQSIAGLLSQYKNLDKHTSILDWGCAAGRVIRWLPKYVSSNLYGCDINCNYIYWCQKYLNNIGIFTQCSSFPHLPFRDNTFDIIYGLSVFTHINQLIDMWLLELKRILKPGGMLLITLHDNSAYQIIKNNLNNKKHTSSGAAFVIKRSFQQFPDISTFDRMSCGNGDPRGNFMFFSDENIRRTFGKIFTIKEKLTILDNSKYDLALNIGNFQTTYVLGNE